MIQISTLHLEHLIKKDWKHFPDIILSRIYFLITIVVGNKIVD